MEWSQRYITQLPLSELWTDSGPISAKRGRELSWEQLRNLLRQGPVQFVIADLRAKPRWLPEADCFTFWTGEVKQRLAEPGELFRFEEFPGEYCYVASEWTSSSGPPIVVLELCH